MFAIIFLSLYTPALELVTKALILKLSRLLISQFNSPLNLFPTMPVESQETS